MALKSSVFMLFLLSMVAGETDRVLEKRQVGVLARSGALPQGKRSVEALARNGELPVASNEKRKNEDVLDLLIEELGTAEGLSRLRLQALAEKLESELGDGYDEYEDYEKRSLVFLDGNSELPQKRMSYPKSGYLVRLSKEASNRESNLPDTEDFLGKDGLDVLTVNGGFNMADNGLASFAKHGYEDDVEDVNYVANYDEDYASLDDIEKRHVGAARNFFGDFLPGGRDKKSADPYGDTAIPGAKGGSGPGPNFDKRHVGATKNFFFSGKRNVGAAKNFLLGGGKRNIGSAKNFGIKRSAGPDGNVEAFAKRGAFYGAEYPSLKDYDWEDVSDSDGLYEPEEKRNVGSFKNFGKRSAAQDEYLPGFFDRELSSKAGNVTGSKADRKGNKARGKREAFPEGAYDEYPVPGYQTSHYETPGSLSDDLEVGKRFMGSSASRPDNEEDIQIAKRHIGALARLGWLPSFRSTRYSRSGRAIENKNFIKYRSNTPVGSCPTKNAAVTWTSPPSAAPKMGLGVRGIFRRVGRSINGGNDILSGTGRRY